MRSASLCVVAVCLAARSAPAVISNHHPTTPDSRQTMVPVHRGCLCVLVLCVLLLCVCRLCAAGDGALCLLLAPLRRSSDASTSNHVGHASANAAGNTTDATAVAAAATATARRRRNANAVSVNGAAEKQQRRGTAETSTTDHDSTERVREEGIGNTLIAFFPCPCRCARCCGPPLTRRCSRPVVSALSRHAAWTLFVVRKTTHNPTARES